MINRSGNQIREDFLRFFEVKGHRRVHSSSLVPANDPTLLFTNAGMNQFKDVFLGAEKRDYSRATTLAEVRPRRRQAQRPRERRLHPPPPHLLRDARQLQLRRLLQEGRHRLRMGTGHLPRVVRHRPNDRLYVTIFEGDDGVPRDDEADQFWLDVGVPNERIFELGAKDNFWQMGDTGPCGPCTEIFYDIGVEAAEDPGIDKPFGEDEPATSKSGTSSSCSSTAPSTPSGPATLTPLPKALHRHRHGPRAHRLRPARRALELRDGSVHAADQPRRAS